MDSETHTFCRLYEEQIKESFYKSILNDCFLLNKNEKYYIKSQPNESIALQNYIYDIVNQHIKSKNITQPNLNIEYSLIEYSENLRVENDNENEKTPLLSILSFIKVSDHCMLFSNINNENYKYKEVCGEDNFYAIVIPTDNTHVVFDGSKYYGFFDIQKKYSEAEAEAEKQAEEEAEAEKQAEEEASVPKIKNSEFYYLKINVWEEDSSSAHLTNTREDQASSVQFIIDYDEQNIIRYNKYVINNEIHENIIYNTNEDYTISSVYDILKEKYSQLIRNVVIYLNLSSNINVNYNYLLNKYGIIVNDILELSSDKNITENNRFYKNKIFQNLISIDVCHWIINETEKNGNWIESSYNNYEYSIKAEEISHVFNYLIFSSNMWIQFLKTKYNVPQDMKINIQDIFVAKNTQNSYKKLTKTMIEKNYFVCNVQINDISHVQGGDIYFDKNTEDKLKLNQGDMLIYNSCRVHDYDEIEVGTSYNLVLIINFELES